MKVKQKWRKFAFGEREGNYFNQRERREINLANQNKQQHRVCERIYPLVRKYCKGCKWWVSKSTKRKLKGEDVLKWATSPIIGQRKWLCRAYLK